MCSYYFFFFFSIFRECVFFSFCYLLCILVVGCLSISYAVSLLHFLVFRIPFIWVDSLTHRAEELKEEKKLDRTRNEYTKLTISAEKICPRVLHTENKNNTRRENSLHTYYIGICDQNIHAFERNKQKKKSRTQRHNKIQKKSFTFATAAASASQRDCACATCIRSK